ncbi:hypothetical protein Tco_1446991 [Tanacetum coccineum]
MYAPQWNNMTIDDVVFQTNNVVGNFNYPPNVPAYKPIMKFLLNYPLNKAFTNCPSVVYQNFLREFWSTAIAFDPEKHTLREFLIKFSVLHGQRPLTLDFKTFCSITGLDYNNGKYMAHPTPEVVKKELGKIAINPSYLDKTPILKNSFLVAWRIQFTFVIQVLSGNYSSIDQVNYIQQLLAFSLITGIEVDIGEIIYNDLVTKLLNKALRLQEHSLRREKKPKSKKPPTETKVTPPKITEGSEQSHSVSSGGNKQPLDKDITSMTPDEGTTKTTPHLEGLLGDKDSGGNIPPTDMEPIHTPITDPSGTGLTQPDPSHVQESASDSSSTDLKKFDNILPFIERQLIKYIRKMSKVLFNQITEKQWEQHEEAAVSYAGLKGSIDQYYDENIAHRDQTDKLVEASMNSLDRSSTTISDLYKGLDFITQLLKDINNTGFDFSALLSTMKDLQAHALKQEELTASWTKSSTNMAWNLGSRMNLAFKDQPSSTPSGSFTLTLALTHIPANIEGENATTTATE